MPNSTEKITEFVQEYLDGNLDNAIGKLTNAVHMRNDEIASNVQRSVGASFDKQTINGDQ